MLPTTADTVVVWTYLVLDVAKPVAFLNPGTLEAIVAGTVGVGVANIRDFDVVQTVLNEKNDDGRGGRRNLLGAAFNATWTITFDVVGSLAEFGYSSADVLAEVVQNSLQRPTFTDLLSSLMGIDAMVESIAAAPVTLTPTPIPTAAPPEAKKVESAAASTLLLGAIAAGAFLLVGLAVCVRRNSKKNVEAKAHADRMSLDIEFELGDLSPDTLARQSSMKQLGSPRKSFRETLEENTYSIPFDALALEERHFAQGGAGKIYRGMYMGQDVAAKELFSTSEEEREEFDREVSSSPRELKQPHPPALSAAPNSTSLL